jgi:hypothetical protein
MEQQRNFQRIKFHSRVDVRIAESNFNCNLTNLALQGTLLESSQSLPISVGDQALITIGLQETEALLCFTARLVHQEQGHYGFLFTEADSGSMAHLRRLLELNFGDGSQADSEFAVWLKQHSNS